METKLEKKRFRNHTSPLMKDSGKSHTRFAGITTKNVSGISPESVAYKQSKAHLAHIAEIEINKARALAETYRLSLR